MVFIKCGFLKTFERHLQAFVMKENAKCSFFPCTFNAMGKKTNEIDHEDQNDLFENIKIVDLMSKCFSEGGASKEASMCASSKEVFWQPS